MKQATWAVSRCAVALLLAGAACAAPAQDKPAAMKAAPPRVEPMPVAPLRPMGAQSGNAGKKFGDDMDCLVEPHLVASVGSPVDGTLREVLVDRGAVVAKGQVLARLNSDVERATVNLKAAQEEFGKRKVARNEELYKKQLISANEKDELETQTRIAALEHQQQQQVLEQRTIRSPFGGVVVERMMSPGERVGDGKILKIAQIDPLNVEVIAPVEMFGRVQPGMTGEVRFEPLLPGTYRATVAVVDRVIDAASGTFGVRLRLPNPANKVPAGIKCSVRFLK
jgi:membrane fusion protein (multidrug efflux system)